MYILLAILPIMITVVLMAFFNQPAKKSLFISWLCSALIALLFWKMPFVELLSRTLFGFLSATETILIIFGAVLLMNVLRKTGLMKTINNMFMYISPDPRIQAIIVGFVFAGFIEGIAGFGTPAAICAPILISLGFPPLAAATVCLIYNSTPVNPGPVGVPLLTATKVVSDSVVELGGDVSRFQTLLTKWIAIPHMIGGMVIIFVGVLALTKLFGKNHSFKDALPALPFSILSGCTVGMIYIFMALVSSPELVSMIGFIGALPLLIVFARKGILTPKDVFEFDEKQSIQLNQTDRPEMKQLVKAWMPYIVIFLILLLTRLNIFHLKEIITSDALALNINHILGIEGVNWNFKFLNNPGVLPFIPVALCTALIVKKDITQEAIRDSFHMVSGAAIALFFGVAMVNIYRYTSNPDIVENVSFIQTIANGTIKNSSMLYLIAYSLAALFKGFYFVIAPFIGVLGAFISGSCTISNTLFAPLQFETATILGLPQIFIVALQSMGGCIGNMICVNNIVAVCATTGTNGSEGKLIKSNIIPAIIYCVVVIIILGIIMATGYNPMPELMG